MASFVKAPESNATQVGLATTTATRSTAQRLKAAEFSSPHALMGIAGVRSLRSTEPALNTVVRS